MGVANQIARSLWRGATSRNGSFRNSFRWSIYIINSVDKPNYLVIPPPTQQHSFFRNSSSLFRLVVWHTFFNTFTDKADCAITMNDEDFVKIMTGKMNPQSVSWNLSTFCFKHTIRATNDGLAHQFKMNQTSSRTFKLNSFPVCYSGFFSRQDQDQGKYGPGYETKRNSAKACQV